MKDKFTGDKEQFIKCRNFLREKGYDVSDAIHIGNNKFEFKEDFFSKKLGCRDIHNILAFVGKYGVEYQKEVVGFMCVD